MRVKLCGFTELETAKIAVAEKCDFLGFVFYEKSPRNISIDKAGYIFKNLPSHIQKVAVVMNSSPEFTNEIATKLSPNLFQFHGEETQNFLTEFRNKFTKIKIIKAINISTENDLSRVKDFENISDMILLDAKNAGSGLAFDWNLLKNFYSKKEWILSGGLNIKNIEDAITTTGAKILDISSGIEEIRGVKSSQLIKNLMQRIRNYHVN